MVRLDTLSVGHHQVGELVDEDGQVRVGVGVDVAGGGVQVEGVEVVEAEPVECGVALLHRRGGNYLFEAPLSLLETRIS